MKQVKKALLKGSGSFFWQVEEGKGEELKVARFGKPHLIASEQYARAIWCISPSVLRSPKQINK